MATLKPFSALRPKADLAAKVCELPYDVMNSDEARDLAKGNPFSFLRVSKPEISLEPSVDVYSDAVYAKGAENFRLLRDQGVLAQDAHPCMYLYRQVMGNHTQTGLVAVASVSEYDNGIIKKHELTRPAKEDDRVRHMEALNSQTGPVFLTYRATAGVDALTKRLISNDPAIDFTSDDRVQHTAWVIDNAEDITLLEAQFGDLDYLYIADGHHRSAAASRVCAARNGAGQSDHFLVVIFPHDQMQILAYNRVIKDLHGQSSCDFLSALENVFVIVEGGAGECTRKNELGLYLDGKWRKLTFKPNCATAETLMDELDVALLQNQVLAPLLGIEDQRTSDRLDFIGGIRGTAELENLVDAGAGCAFSMFPTSIEDLMAIADADG